MRDVFFESDHAAKINYPYTDFEWRNIHFYSHFHEEIELAAVVSGSVSVTGDERALLAKTGDICVFMPGEIHSLTSDAENHLYIFKICCQSAKENIDFAAFRIKPDILTPEHPLNAALWTDIRRIKAASEQKSPGYSYLVNATANEMLYKIVSGGVLYKLDRQKRQKNISAISILTKSSEYIRAHYAEPTLLAEAAGYCGFSKYYFAHYFKEITGLTFYEYLTGYRMQMAVAALQNSETGISEIALNCGFSNVRSFNRVFKAAFGTTPSKYRKNKH